jgi:hypothetical protein
MAHVISLQRRQRRVRQVEKPRTSRWTVKAHADLLSAGGQACLRANCAVTIEAGIEIDRRLIIAQALRAEADALERDAAKKVPAVATP